MPHQGADFVPGVSAANFHTLSIPVQENSLSGVVAVRRGDQYKRRLNLERDWLILQSEK